MAKLLIATPYPNAVKTIAKTFREHRLNDAQTANIWFTRTDFMLEAESKTYTNTHLLHNKKPWTVLQFETDEIERADAKADPVVTLEELAETVIKSNPTRISDGTIKFIVTDESKKALNNIINKVYVSTPNKQKVQPTINNNLVNEQVLSKERINLRPSLVPNLDDDKISGMDDILGEVAKDKAAKRKDLEESTRILLEE